MISPRQRRGVVAARIGAVLAVSLSLVAGPVPPAPAAAPEYQIYPVPVDPVTGTDPVITRPQSEVPLVTARITLRAGESRRVYGRTFARMLTSIGRNMDDTTGIRCDDPGGVTRVATYPQQGLLPATTLLLQPSVLLTAPTAGVYTCSLLASTGSAGARMAVLHDQSYLAISTADEAGAAMWQNADCSSDGRSGECLYLGSGDGPNGAHLLDNAASPWTAANSSTSIGVTANVELTECGHTASCGGREHDADNATVSSHLRIIQLYPNGSACNETRSVERVDRIDIYHHHYNIAYPSVPVPVLATCNGSRRFRVFVDMRWLSGNSVKIDGSRQDGEIRQANTNMVVWNGSQRATATVPRVLGLSLTAATSTLLTAQLNVGTVTTRPNAAPVGTVVAQNSPAGTVEPAGSPVNLSVSGGPGTFTGTATAAKPAKALQLAVDRAWTKARNVGFTICDAVDESSEPNDQGTWDASHTIACSG